MSRNISRKRKLLGEERWEEYQKIRQNLKALRWTQKQAGYHVKSWRKRTKLKLIEHKGGKCEICGYDKYPEVLEFHHKDPTQKNFSISSSSNNLDSMKKESDKCMLVCANCHREIHHNLRQNNPSHSEVLRKNVDKVQRQLDEFNLLISKILAT